jgi:integrase
MLRLGLRVSEACSLRASSVHWNHGRWTIRLKVKGGRERTLPLPQEVRQAVDEHLKLDRKRRGVLHSDGPDAYLFQPAVNYRTLEFAKPLSTRMAWNVVQKWAEYGRLGRLSPHDLRRARSANVRARPAGKGIRGGAGCQRDVMTDRLSLLR